MRHTTSFRAMGTEVFIELESPFDPGEAFLVARELFELQESRFSRFRPGSLLSRFNRGECIEDASFAEVVVMAIQAHATTVGMFNPMVLPALADAGYSASLNDIRGGRPSPQHVPAPGDAIEIRGHSVRLLKGGLDLGGLAKGWTVDLCAIVLSQFSPQVVVNAGGDLRIIGAPGRQPFGITCPICGELTWTGRVPHAVATSTTCRRRWLTDSGDIAHHIIDPRTGLPVRSEFLQVSVFADTAAEAEVWAKAILIGGHQCATTARESGLEAFTVRKVADSSRCVHR